MESAVKKRMVGLLIFFVVAACTTQTPLSSDTVLNTDTVNPVDTAISTQAGFHPLGMKWYVDTGAVFAATFDKDGYLWTGGFGLIYKWDLDNNSFNSYELPNEAMPARINSMIIDKEGVVWVSTADTVWKYTDQGFVKSLTLENPRLGIYLISSSKGEFIAYQDRSFYILEGSLWNEYQVEAPIESLAIGEDGTIWLVLFIRGEGNFESKGVFQFNGRDFKEVPEFSNTNDLYRVKTCDGNIWFFTEGRGSAVAIKFDGVEWIKYPQKTELEGNVIELACDDENNLKVFTNKFILKFNGNNFDRIYYPNKTAGGSIAIDSSGKYCLGSLDGVFCEQNGKWALYLEPGLPEWGILSIAIASDNSIWFGTYDRGVAHLSGTSWSFYTENNGLPSNNANDVKIDKYGTVWVGTNEGLARFDGNKWTTFTTADGLIDYSIATIWIGDNLIWVGGVGGASLWNGKEWQSFPRGDYPLEGVLTIAVDSDGITWFGTYSGLVSYDGSNWKVFNREDGLMNEWIDNLAITSNNILLLNPYLTLIDKTTVQIFDREQLPISGGRALTFVDDCTFMITDGVIKLRNGIPELKPWKSINLRSPDVNSIISASDKSVWFATFGGALHLKGEEFIPNELYTGCEN